MARLSKANVYAIQWLNSQGKTPEEISDELSITLKQTNSVLEKQSKASSDNNIKTAKSNASRSQGLMIRETAGKKNNSVAIMTGEASMLNDELKTKSFSNPNQLKTDKYIYRPKK